MFYILLLLVSLPTALVFMILYALRKRTICLLASLAWLLPVAYEGLIQVNCTGECNIRVDLLVVLPLEILLLGSLSIAAVRSFVAARAAVEEEKQVG